MTVKETIDTAIEVMKDFTKELVKKIPPEERLNALAVASIHKNSSMDMYNAKCAAHYILGYYNLKSIE